MQRIRVGMRGIRSGNAENQGGNGGKEQNRNRKKWKKVYKNYIFFLKLKK